MRTEDEVRRGRGRPLEATSVMTFLIMSARSATASFDLVLDFGSLGRFALEAVDSPHCAEVVYCSVSGWNSFQFCKLFVLPVWSEFSGEFPSLRDVVDCVRCSEHFFLISNHVSGSI